MAKMAVKTYFDSEALAAKIDASPLSQVEMAKRLKVSPVHISRVKKGVASISLLIELGQLLGFDYRWLLLPPERITHSNAIFATKGVDRINIHG